MYQYYRMMTKLQCCTVIRASILTCTCTYASEFLISFEAWVKLAQQWLACAPLGIHLELINKQLMLLVTI